MVLNIDEFYKNRNVFITGGTGFVGLCLIEKLLRCCPDISNIYLLLRTKKGKTIEQRLEEVIKNSVFNRLKEEGKTDLFKKLIPIGGDVGEENLGLSTSDRLTLVEQINIVFHSAATLDFEADLRSTTNINLLGTRRVVNLCQEIKYLKAFVHVSSAYVNAALKEAKEIIYPAPADVREFLKTVKELNDEELNNATPTILNGHVNPYTFTKHLAEHEVANSHLPCSIVRPSMITGSWKEPVPGWTVSKNGPQGFLMGASKGVVRRLPVATNLVYDYIPVDVVVNCLIAASYSVDRDGAKSCKVYHCTSSTSKPFKWDIVENKINVYLHTYPLHSAVWYPHLKLLPSLFWFRISAIFVHMIPAYILDALIKLFGGRPRLVRLHTSINKSLGRLEKFIFSEWKFYNPETIELHNSLSKEDQKTFTMDITTLDWETYFIDLTRGVRIYLNNEPLKNMKKAQFKDQILLILHLALQFLVLAFFWWIAKISFGTTWTKTGLIVPIMYFVLSQL